MLRLARCIYNLLKMKLRHSREKTIFWWLTMALPSVVQSYLRICQYGWSFWVWREELRGCAV